MHHGIAKGNTNYVKVYMGIIEIWSKDSTNWCIDVREASHIIDKGFLRHSYIL